MRSIGRSAASVWTLPSCFTTPMPLQTRPKMVCFPSRWGWGASVIKNCNRGQVLVSMHIIFSMPVEG